MCKWHLVPVTVGCCCFLTVNRDTFLCPVCRSLSSRRDSTWQTSMPGAPSSRARPTPTSPGPSVSPAVWHCSWPTWLSMPSGTNDNHRRWEGNTITWKGGGRGTFLTNWLTNSFHLLLFIVGLDNLTWIFYLKIIIFKPNTKGAKRTTFLLGLQRRGEFGLLDVSWRSLAVGAICCAVVFPLHLFLAFLFRRSRVRIVDFFKRNSLCFATVRI